MVPALLTAAQERGLRAWRSMGTSAVVELPDGVYLGWQTSMDHRDFELHITLPETPPAEVDARLHAAKARADELWTAAVAARQQSAVAPAYAPADAPPPPPASSFSVGVSVGR